MFKRAALFAILTIPFTACGSAEEEEPPACPRVGTYVLEFANKSGTCAAEFVNRITSSRQAIEVNETDSCGYSRETTTRTENGCTLTLNIGLTTTADGVEADDMVFTATCEDGRMCEQTFLVQVSQ